MLFYSYRTFRRNFIILPFTDIHRSRTGSTAPARRARMVGRASIAFRGSISSSAADPSNTSGATEKNFKRSGPRKPTQQTKCIDKYNANSLQLPDQSKPSRLQVKAVGHVGVRSSGTTRCFPDNWPRGKGNH